MATVSYSVSGEGRGHAARARVLIEQLKESHRLIVYCYGDARELLQPVCRQWGVEVREIPGLRFAYDSRGTLSRSASALRALPFLTTAPEWIFRLARWMERDGTDLALVDFEPLLPRAAHLARIPSVAIDHQQFLVSCDLSELPTRLRPGAKLLSAMSGPFYKAPVSSVISSFFFPPLKPSAKNVRQAGVLLRREVLEVEPAERGHLVAYVRRRPPKNVLSALSALGHPVKVYGADVRGSTGGLEFCPIDPRAFAQDLANSCGLVTTAGNQVVGEALSLGKPVLAYPEPGNIEQQINGYYLERSGAGLTVDAPRLSVDTLRSFLDQRELLRLRINSARMNGNSVALAAIEAAARHGTAAASQDDTRCPAPQPGF